MGRAVSLSDCGSGSTCEESVKKSAKDATNGNQRSCWVIIFNSHLAVGSYFMSWIHSCKDSRLDFFCSPCYPGLQLFSLCHSFEPFFSCFLSQTKISTLDEVWIDMVADWDTGLLPTAITVQPSSIVAKMLRHFWHINNGLKAIFFFFRFSSMDFIITTCSLITALCLDYIPISTASCMCRRNNQSFTHYEVSACLWFCIFP